MMLLLVLYNVRSERELMSTIPLRLDWLWFLGYDLDSEVPNHSVLSKARMRWGVEAFRSLAWHDRGLRAHIPDIKRSQDNTGRREGIFPLEAFRYDPQADRYYCPAGQALEPRRRHAKRQSADYLCARGVCGACELRGRCTTAKTGRSIKRHLRQDELDRMRERTRSALARQDIRTRQHLMERSFACATRYGFKRARWRRLWRVQIQEYLTAAVQNLMTLLRHLKERSTACGVRRPAAVPGSTIGPLDRIFCGIASYADRLRSFSFEPSMSGSFKHYPVY